MDFEGMEQEVKEMVSSKRWRHTEGVRYTCACLAMRYGEDLKKAQIAGLLHDYAKGFSDQKLLEECKKHNLTVSPVEERNPYLLHGKVAAWYGSHKFKITDETILSAIICHTTGKPAMCPLEMILFVADYMEPGRKEIPGLNEIRAMAFIDLTKTVTMILTNTLGYLKENDSSKEEIDPMTEAAWNYYTSAKVKGKENT